MGFDLGIIEVLYRGRQISLKKKRFIQNVEQSVFEDIRN
jgi:hypothetical protein